MWKVMEATGLTTQRGAKLSGKLPVNRRVYRCFRHPTYIRCSTSVCEKLRKTPVESCSSETRVPFSQSVYNAYVKMYDLLTQGPGGC